MSKLGATTLGTEAVGAGPAGAGTMGAITWGAATVDAASRAGGGAGSGDAAAGNDGLAATLGGLAGASGKLVAVSWGAAGVAATFKSEGGGGGATAGGALIATIVGGGGARAAGAATTGGGSGPAAELAGRAADRAPPGGTAAGAAETGGRMVGTAATSAAAVGAATADGGRAASVLAARESGRAATGGATIGAATMDGGVVVPTRTGTAAGGETVAICAGASLTATAGGGGGGIPSGGGVDGDTCGNTAGAARLGDASTITGAAPVAERVACDTTVGGVFASGGDAAGAGDASREVSGAMGAGRVPGDNQTHMPPIMASTATAAIQRRGDDRPFACPEAGTILDILVNVYGQLPMSRRVSARNSMCRIGGLFGLCDKRRATPETAMSQRPPNRVPTRPPTARPPRANLRPSQALRLPMRVWDVPTRLFAPLLALLSIAAWLGWVRGQMAAHVACGYAVLALLVFRVVWGFVGSDTARFANFLKGPARVASELPQLRGREPDNIVGHSVVGGWWLVLVLLAAAAAALTGIAVRRDAALAASVTRWHGIAAIVLLGAIVLQALVLATAALSGRGAVPREMMSGKKRLPAATRAPRLAPGWLAAAILLLAVAVTAAVAAGI